MWKRLSLYKNRAFQGVKWEIKVGEIHMWVSDGWHVFEPQPTKIHMWVNYNKLFVTRRLAGDPLVALWCSNKQRVHEWTEIIFEWEYDDWEILKRMDSC